MAVEMIVDHWNPQQKRYRTGNWVIEIVFPSGP